MSTRSTALELTLNEAKNRIKLNQIELFYHYSSELVEDPASISELFNETLTREKLEFTKTLIDVIGLEAFLRKQDLRASVNQHYIQAAKDGELEKCQALAELVSPRVMIDTKAQLAALVGAASLGRLEVCDYLLEGDFYRNINEKDDSGRLALCEAVKLFVYSENKSRAPDLSPSLRPRLEEKTEKVASIIRLLIDRRANVNQKNGENQTALEIAAATGNLELLALLKPELDSFDARCDWIIANSYLPWLQEIIAELRVSGSGELSSFLNESLLKAIEHRKNDCVLYLLTEGADPSQVATNGLPIWVNAFNTGSQDIAGEIFRWFFQQGKSLPEEGLNPTGRRLLEKLNKDYQNEHPLILLAKNGSLDLNLERLIDNGVDINFVDGHGNSALFYAVQNGHHELVSRLVELGADVNLSKEGNISPIQLAGLGSSSNRAQAESLSISFLYLVEKADETSLRDLIKINASESVATLLARGIPLPIKDNKLDDGLFQFEQSAYEIYKHIQANGPGFLNERLGSRGQAFLNSVNSQKHPLGFTPVKSALQVAIENRDLERVKQLIEEKGFDLRLKDHMGYNALSWAAELTEDNSEILTYLLETQGMDPNEQASDNTTALHWAAQSGNRANARILLEFGARSNLFSKKGNTAYLMALRTNNFDVAVLMWREALCLGFSPRHFGSISSSFTQLHQRVVENVGSVETALSELIQGEQTDQSLEELTTLIVRRKPNLEHRNKDGKTALELAVERNHISAVQLLLANDASVTDAEHLMAKALKEGYLDVIFLLLDRLCSDGGMNPLYKAATLAVEENNIALLEYCLAKPGFDVNYENYPNRVVGSTLISLAASYSHLEIIKFLEKNGARLNSGVDRDGRRPIDYALSQKHKKEGQNDLLAHRELVTYFYLTAEKPVMSVLATGDTPTILTSIKQECGDRLRKATEDADIEAVDALLAEGIWVSEKDKVGKTALHYAAGANNEELVSHLLAKGICLEERDQENNRALDLAIQAGHNEAARLIIDAIFEKEGIAALYAYVEEIIDQNNQELLIHCLDKPGFDLNYQRFPVRQGGSTMITFCSVRGNLSLIQLLKERGANLDPYPNAGGHKPIHLASCHADDPWHGRTKEDYLEVIRFLYLNSKKPVLNLSIRGGTTTLSKADVYVQLVQKENGAKLREAIREDNTQEIDRLLREGVWVDEKDEYGKSALYHAVEQDKPELIKFLLANGANPNVQGSQGKTPLMLAFERKNLKSYMALLTSHVESFKGRSSARLIDFSVKDNVGNQAIHYALFVGKYEVINFLVKNFSININAQGENGQSLLHFSRGNFDAITRLIGLFDIDVNLTDANGKTALEAAQGRGEDVVEELYAYLATQFNKNFSISDLNKRARFRNVIMRSVSSFRHDCLRAYLNGCDSFSELAHFPYVNSHGLSEEIRAYIYSDMLTLFSRANTQRISYKERLKTITNTLGYAYGDSALVSALGHLERDLRANSTDEFKRGVQTGSQAISSSDPRFFQQTPEADPRLEQKKELIAALQYKHKLDFGQEESRVYWGISRLRGVSYSLEHFHVRKINQAICIYKEAQEVAVLLERYNNKGSYQELVSELKAIRARHQQRNERNPSERLTALVDDLKSDEELERVCSRYRSAQEYAYLNEFK